MNDNNFYKKEYSRLENYITYSLYSKVLQIYNNNISDTLKHDGSICSKISYMLDEINKIKK